MHAPTPFRPADYGPVFAGLLAEPRLAPLDAGSPNHAAYSRLKSLDLAGAFAPHRVVDEDMAKACLAGLWLYHDFLEESHVLSQEISTPTGSYWHGLMHRREPDFENAKYWFRRVGQHPLFESLCEEAAKLGWKSWDALAFVDLCQRGSGEGGSLERACREAQRAEWELLFAYSFNRAIGA